MAKMMNVTDTRWNFYECKEAESIDGMADYFETLYFHYRERGLKIIELRAKIKALEK